ncbi:hypothetical protein DFAR_1310018 [Desulfarculales bacterium]
MLAHGLPVVQLDKDDVEAPELIKMDLLGLRRHSAITASLEALARARQTLDLERVPLDDPTVYELLCSTDTLDIFQVESLGRGGCWAAWNHSASTISSWR